MMGEEEFDAFFSVSYSRLAGQLYALTGDWGEALEVVLEAYVRAWDQRSHFDLESAPDSWIRTVAWRLATSQARSRRHQRAELGTSAPPGVEQLEFMRALRKLGEDERRVLVLHYLCGLSIEEIAVETGVTVNMAMAGLARGRAALRPMEYLEYADGRGLPYAYQIVADEVLDFANQHAHPRLTALQVRVQGVRRGRARRSAAASGVGAIAVAGAITVALLVGRPSSPHVAPSAGHPTVTTHHGLLATKSPRATPSARL